MSSSTDFVKRKSIDVYFKKYFGILLLILLTVIFWFIFKVISPHNFGTPGRLLSYFQSSLIYAVGGCGLYFIVAMGLWDFSIGANLVLSSILACYFSQHYGYLGLILAPIVSGTLIGLLNGIVYINFHIPSMIVTVGLSLIYESLSVFATQGQEQILGPNYRAFGTYPYNVILAICAFIFVSLVIKYTKMGTYMYAIGSNEYLAKNMGVDVNRFKVLSYVLCGFLVGIMSILNISYGTSMTAASGMSSMSMNFTPLMGTFFGLSFRKYGTPVIAIIIGEFIISLIFNGFVAIGAPTTIQNVVTGIALLLIVTITTKPVRGIVVK
ncbi:ABC-type transporter, integral membrane subunit [Thermoanaerobacterium xylanolyticum LX-11]|uniref:ABC-type transporter, integral membrane subunit n=1 Tax=Thermoanaerobacterium xylanolyticum (strain ATCC 49914 / DSM 7097 / LX-11) TaxID=858215 RepID=F6BHM1_THEXL|nr:branched-chain amino acid ABC transporter permease [Thermoanaerobacterium xylanolyticum]AEF16602.1 ABC-type transporter, integral membrane subunit [Thermoanaerobacterium xylanolyticum LX-11]